MKNLFKRFTAVIAAVLIFFISVVPSSVSAYTTVSFDIPFNFYNNSSLDDSTVKTIFDNIYNNQSIIDLGYSSENSTLCIYEADGTIRIYIQKTDFFVNVGSGCILNFENDGYPKYIYYSFSNNSSSISDLLYYSFSLTSISYPGSGYRTYNLPVFDSTNNQYFIACINSNYYYGHNLSLMNGYSDSNPDISKPLAFFYNYVPSASKPDVSDKLTFTGVRLGVDKKGFLEWLISEGKESVINSTGFNFTQKQLSLLVDVFDSYGNNSFWFYSSLVKTFKLTQHSLTGASALLSTLQELYRDYLDYKNSIEIVEITPDDSAKPHWRQDKTDNSLVTDLEDDTSVVSILREILRTIIYLPSSIRTSFSDLATNIVSIMYNWNRLFDKLDYISPDISGDVDRLIDAINNISVDVPDTSVDVTITDEKQQELDDFFNGWSVDFDNKVKEKFPVTAQLGELFNDDFFEKCGIDCNGDGEVYSYYSENVYAVSEFSTVPELSASAPGSDQKLVSDFIGQFDSADVNFLNDANFSSSVPDWSITVGGKKCEVFSFKLYAKYRTQIHFIISFILWTVYLLSLYKSLPSIIGQVSDVVHGIEKM
ncbi:MAG: hypothetical protein MSH15_07875 [Oscillospiraceae bacterium]|nr:hypothetical protein [Oscillospiraceae bacterium]